MSCPQVCFTTLQNPQPTTTPLLTKWCFTPEPEENEVSTGYGAPPPSSYAPSSPVLPPPPPQQGFDLGNKEFIKHNNSNYSSPTRLLSRPASSSTTSTSIKPASTSAFPLRERGACLPTAALKLWGNPGWPNWRSLVDKQSKMFCFGTLILVKENHECQNTPLGTSPTKDLWLQIGWAFSSPTPGWWRDWYKLENWPGTQAGSMLRDLFSGIRNSASHWVQSASQPRVWKTSEWWVRLEMSFSGNDCINHISLSMFYGNMCPGMGGLLPLRITWTMTTLNTLSRYFANIHRMASNKSI